MILLDTTRQNFKSGQEVAKVLPSDPAPKRNAARTHKDFWKARLERRCYTEEGQLRQVDEYQMVLDNVALFVRSQNSLPSYAQISGGVIDANNTLGLGNQSISYAWVPWSWGAGFNASRKWQETWTLVPVTDIPTLQKLTTIFTDAAKQNWINHGTQAPTSASLVGHSGTVYVWVDPSARSKLTDLTLSVLAAMPNNVKRSPSGPSFLIQ